MKIFENNSLKKRLIIYFMAIIISMSVLNLFPYYTISVLMNNMSSTFEKNVELNNLMKTMEKVNYSYEAYLETKHSKNLDDYYRYSNELTNEVNKIVIDNGDKNNVLLLKDIKNMISNYQDEMNAAVSARRARMLDNYLYHYNESAKIYGYINEYVQKLNNSMLTQNTDVYVSLSKSIQLVEALNIGLILYIFILNIALIIWFTYKITKPIFELSRAADEISHGNFDVPKVKVNSNDEIGIMAEAFNRMTKSIRRYIKELQEKAELERKLQEKDLENMMIKANLKEAELHALQAQINPHFLFNTLNAGAQLAMLEGADRACTFIENAADLFRYSMRNLDKSVTLEDEIKNIENYTHLLNERFADKIKFNIKKEESALSVKMPCMILQPIIENAFLHGIDDIDRIGIISLEVSIRDNFAIISIQDNGKGMSQEKIEEILRGDLNEKTKVENEHSGHTNGIGMNNILSRLKIFYNREDIVEIFSTLGVGTEIVLRIPIEKS